MGKYYDKTGSALVDFAEETIDAYYSNNYGGAYESSLKFYNKYHELVTKKELDNDKKIAPNFTDAEIAPLFGDDEILATLKPEFDIMHLRLTTYAKHPERKVTRSGAFHLARMMDFLLVEHGIVNKSAFKKENNFIFPEGQKEIYEDELRLFYRNAYRAELFTYPITMVTGEKYTDNYIGIILARNAIEQFVKMRCDKYDLYDKSVGGKIEYSQYASKRTKANGEVVSVKLLEGVEFVLQEAVKRLSASRKITEDLKIELDCIRKRGNTNTHDSKANYGFVNEHAVLVLKECFDILVKEFPEKIKK